MRRSPMFCISANGNLSFLLVTSRVQRDPQAAVEISGGGIELEVIDCRE
jgi:hypothetical protein